MGTTFQWITAFIAAWGAGLGTYNFVIQRRKDRRSLKIEFGIRPVSRHGKKISDGLLFHISNDGHRTVYLDQVDVIMPDNKAMPIKDLESESDLRCELKEGQGITAWVDVRKFALDLWEAGYRGHVALKPRCVDRTTKQYFGSPVDFDLDRWHLRL
jgi:hypothetical protein